MEHPVNNEPAAPNPNELLAVQIFQQLLQAGLIADDNQAGFVKNLSQGTLKDGDWKITLEQVLHTHPPTNETTET